MKCFYINLDRALGRRNSIESSFARSKKENWSLTRIPAVDASHVQSEKIPGKISPSEKGCFLSHIKVLEHNVDLSEHFFILEDDAIFGRSTCQLADKFTQIQNKAFDWDILFTDLGIGSIGAMAELVRIRQKLASRNEQDVIDLRFLDYYFGATAYIVNRRSIQKLLSIVKKAPMDEPYDIFLRRMIHERKINAFATVPFLTSLSEGTVDSAVQRSEHARTELIWSLFRRMVWLDGDDFDPKESLGEIAKSISERSKAYGLLWSCMIDPSFTLK
jgi:GR25 family glycosyltransferase involved in LPS biosynthesis